MIDTKALRSRILELAIQGKLTEQLESDGTAEELWQQIQAEKQRLIKEGRISPKPVPDTFIVSLAIYSFLFFVEIHLKCPPLR